MAEGNGVPSWVGMVISGVALIAALLGSYAISVRNEATQKEKVSALERTLDDEKGKLETLRLLLAGATEKATGESAKTGQAIEQLKADILKQQGAFLDRERVLEAIQQVRKLQADTVPEKRIEGIEALIKENASTVLKLNTGIVESTNSNASAVEVMRVELLAAKELFAAKLNAADLTIIKLITELDAEQGKAIINLTGEQANSLTGLEGRLNQSILRVTSDMSQSIAGLDGRQKLADNRIEGLVIDLAKPSRSIQQIAALTQRLEVVEVRGNKNNEVVNQHLSKAAHPIATQNIQRNGRLIENLQGFHLTRTGQASFSNKHPD